MTPAEKLTQIAENIPKVYEAGKNAAYDAFWDAYQNNGNLKSYCGAFGSGFNAKTFKPKYPIVPQRSYNHDNPEANMFYYTNRDYSTKLDLTNYPIDLSRLETKYKGGCTTVFNNAYVDNIFIDLKGVTSVNQLFNYNNSSLEPSSIKLRITDSLTSTANMFYYLGDIPDAPLAISFTEDSVLVASLGLNQATYLKKETIYNIFSVMSDDVTGKTLTLKSAAVTRIFGSLDNEEWQTLIASKPNWTISLI